MSAPSATTSSGLQEPRLVITTHSDDGTSTFLTDTKVPLLRPFGPTASAFGRFHSRLSVPASNTTNPPDLSKEIPRPTPNGVLFCSTDIAAGFTVPMHRTISLDYCVVMSGEIVLLLDGGEEKTVKAGEVIVQRGTTHSWINRTNEVCRIMFVMVGSEKVVLPDGRVLEEVVPKRP